MAHTIIDRTLRNKTKGSTNRAKFTKRASRNIKEAVKDYIANGADIKSISDGKQKKIKVSNKTLDEPLIVHGSESTKRRVVIGNKDYEVGDLIKKPTKSGSSNTAGDSGEGEDDFYFQLDHKEFLDIFFDGLELPDLIKKQIMEDCEIKPHHNGYTTTGSPVRLDLKKSLVNSYKRHVAIGGAIDIEIEECQKRLETATSQDEKDALLLEIAELEKQKNEVPFLQELDLRYRNILMVPEPATKAVMFCILDVSGSMEKWHKEIAKRFFMILYLFLTKQYENVELVFIKHHHAAFEVTEHDFFYSRENGGTVVSEALKLIRDIMKSRYSSSAYNSYVCQMSDGDNFGSEEENEKLENLIEEILPLVQYFAFVDIKRKFPPFVGGFMTQSSDEPTELMSQYITIKDSNYKHGYKFNLRSITALADIYQVFRSLFEKKVEEK
jgi:uncharacterized sporulation protein YeaH/YhbH (DUF444 family)